MRQKLEEALLELGPSQGASGANALLAPPSAVALLQQERAHHEVRNAKVLALLRSKDEALGHLESRCADATAEAAQLRAQLQTSSLQLEEAQERVQDLLEEKKTHKRKILEAETQCEEALAEAAHLRAAAARGEEAGTAIEHLSSELASSRDQVITLTTALQAEDELIEGTELEKRELLAERHENRRKIEELQQHLLRLLGMASEEAERAALLSTHAQHDTGDWPPDAGVRIAALEEVNEALETALVAANLRIAGVDPSRHSSLDTLLSELAASAAAGACAQHVKEKNADYLGGHIEDQDEIVRLSAEVADLGGKLETAEQEKNHLEAAHNVAQRAAIQAESELQEALRREEEMKANEAALVEKLAAEEARAGAAEALCVELQKSVDDATTEATSYADREEVLVKKCASLEHRVVDSEEAAEKAQTAAAVAMSEATAAKEEAAEKVEAALRQCNKLRTQMLDAQAENDELKSKIAQLESKIAHAAAKAAAREAAGALVARRHRGAAYEGHGPVEELARSLEQAAEQQIELHRELQVVTELNAVHEGTIESLRHSVTRLRAALADEDRSSPAEDGTADCTTQNTTHGTTIAKESQGETLPLREQLICSLAAQKGQAAAFAVLIEEASQRELLLEARIGEVQLVEEERQRLEEACTAAVATMQGALAQVALAEGSRDAGEALLHAAVDPGDLGQCTSAVASKLQVTKSLDSVSEICWLNGFILSFSMQDLAKLITQQRQEEQGTTLSPAAALAATQRDVIAALSAQLAVTTTGSIGGATSTFDHSASQLHQGTSPGTSALAAEPTGEASTTRQRTESMKGLCGLLLHQLQAIETAAGGDSLDALHAAIQSMQSTIIILQTEITTAGGAAGSAPPSPGGAAPVAPVQQEENLSTKAADEARAVLEHQVLELMEKLTMMTERVSLLTAANEAAQAEACHSRAAVAELAEALQATTMEFEEAMLQATARESKLTCQLEESQGECRKLLESLHRLDKDQQAWEDQVNAKVATLQAQLEASTLQRGKNKGWADTPSNASPGRQSSVPAHVPPGLGPLLDGLDTLLGDAAAMEERLRDLEAAAVQAENERAQETQLRWEEMSTGLLRTRDIAAVWEEARKEMASLEAGRAKQAQRAAELAEKVAEMEQEREELMHRLEAVREVHERQLQHAAELHAAQLAAAAAAANADRHEALRQGEAAALAAAAAGEQRARQDLGDSVDNARRALEEAQRLCARLRTERDAVHGEFIKYREVKAAEIQLLEQRLGIFVQSDTENGTDSAPLEVPSGTSDVEIATAAGQIAAACRADAVAAALREAKMERSHRLQLHQALNNAQNAEKRAVAATRAAEKEIASLRQRLRESTVVAEQQARELASEIERAQYEAEEAKNKAAQSGAEVEELLERVAGMAELAAHSEKERRQAAEREIHAARAALSTRGAVIGDLGGRVARAERGLEELSHDLDGASGI